jgi:hypothetical protein
MSISYNTSGAKSEADKKKKTLEYKALLQLRVDANNRIAKALEELDQNRISGMPQMPAPYTSAAEEIADLVLQRDIAFKTLKTIMKEGDASIATQQLQAANQLPEFNRFSSQFLSDIKNMSNITPAIFSALWDRFQIKLAGTVESGTPTGIIIGAEKGEYDAKLKSIEDKLTLLTPLATSGPIEKMIIDLCGSDLKELDSVFEEVFDTIEKKPLKVGEDIEIYDEDGEIQLLYQVEAITYKGEATWGLRPYTPKTGKLSKTALTVPKANNAKIRYIVYHKTGEPTNIKFEWTGDPKTVKALVIPAKKPGVKSGTGLLSNDTRPITKDNIKNKYAFRKEVNLLRKKYAANGILSKAEAETHTLNDANFGKYYLSENYLKRGYLMLRHKSGSSTPFTRKPILISPKLQSIFKNIIYTDHSNRLHKPHFNEEDYNKLSDAEKKLFDDLLIYAKLDKLNGIDFYKHKKYNDDQNEKDIERYKVLVGQIGAGNNNMEIVKELKALIFRMADAGIINTRDYNKTIHMLCLISSV